MPMSSYSMIAQCVSLLYTKSLMFDVWSLESPKSAYRDKARLSPLA